MHLQNICVICASKICQGCLIITGIQIEYKIHYTCIHKIDTLEVTLKKRRFLAFFRFYLKVYLMIRPPLCLPRDFCILSRKKNIFIQIFYSFNVKKNSVSNSCIRNSTMEKKILRGGHNVSMKAISAFTMVDLFGRVLIYL